MAAHLIVDRFIDFTAGSGIEVVAPRRVLDTRDGTGSPVAAGGVVTLDAGSLGVTTGTTGVMLNLTVTDALGPGFLTAYPCTEGRPATSNLNYVAGDVVAKAKVFVNVTPVQVDWKREGNLMTGTVPSGSGAGPWVVRVEVADDTGSVVGRDFLEIAPSRLAQAK